MNKQNVSLNSLTPYVRHTLSSNNIFSTFFFCCQCYVFLAASPVKRISIHVYQVQQNCSMLPCYHCAVGCICPLHHGVTGIHCSPSYRNSHKISSAIFCSVLLHKFLSRWLAECLKPIWWVLSSCLFTLCCKLLVCYEGFWFSVFSYCWPFSLWPLLIHSRDFSCYYCN